uniref:Uncharacterized protein n=1 Tax=Aplanochytrium stocchinoi TaxID=215587 RepID=A0A7S3V0M0_9STRA
MDTLSVSLPSGTDSFPLRWESSFQTEYVRKRNSRSGTKNIRCFPCCSSPHNAGGFCGVPAILKCDSLEEVLGKISEITGYDAAVLSANNLKARARFHVVDNHKANDGDISCIESYFNDGMRTSKDPTAQWIPVSITQEEGKDPSSNTPMKLIINTELLGWHYNWRSNKSTADRKHSLVVYLYYKLSDESKIGSSLHLLGKFPSPMFKITSGQRAQQQSKPSTNTNVNIIKPRTMSNPSSGPLSPYKNNEEEDVNVRIKRKLPESKSNVDIISRLKAEAKDESMPLQASTEEHESIRSLLSATISKAKQKVLNLNSATDVNVMDDENIVSVLDMFSDQSFLDIGDDSSLNGVSIEGSCSSFTPSDHSFDSADFPEKEDLIRAQIVESIGSETLTAEISAFFRDCSSGPIGASLCENLKKEEDIQNNPFLREFCKSLFQKFQLIISKRLWDDLYQKDLLDQPWKRNGEIRGSIDSTYRASKTNSTETELGLLYDPDDFQAVHSFIKRLKKHYDAPNDLSELAGDSKFSMCNKTWVKEETPVCWFKDIMCKQLGYFDEVLAEVYACSGKRMTLSLVDDACRVVMHEKSLTTSGFWEIKTDGIIRPANMESPLDQYIQVPPKVGVATHQILADGSYEMLWTNWYKYSDIAPADKLKEKNVDDKFVVCSFQYEVNVDNPDVQLVTARTYNVRGDPGNEPIDVWKTDKFAENLDAKMTWKYFAEPNDP